MNYRVFIPTDRAGCLSLFDGNAERFFSPGDRDIFAAFLATPLGFFGVLEDECRNLAGCGGLGVRNHGQSAVLTWGMVDEALHGQGLGKELLLSRLRLLDESPAVTRVVVNTTQLTAGFYRKFGFVRTRAETDGYRLGLDRVRLELVVDETWRRRHFA